MRSGSDPTATASKTTAGTVRRVIDCSWGLTPNAIEAAGVATVGGALGALVGTPFGLTVPAALVGAANGAVSGWRRIYDWRSTKGITAVVLDSTWSLVMTSGGLASHVLGALRGSPGYDPALSERANRHVYRRGFTPRRGFAITVGNVISGAGDTALDRRRHLVVAHEDVHVWQARWFGPLFPVLYGGWMVIGAGIGSAVWVVRHRGERFGAVVESVAYYLNPFEWWAYSRAGNWPPSGLAKGIGWSRPIVTPLRRR